MPDAHARLSPSGSERWLQCPASIRMEEQVPPEPESSYAREGTAAHALAEIEASFQLLGEDTATYDQRVQDWYQEYLQDVDDLPEMEEYVQGYVGLLRERLENYPSSVLMLEQRLDTGVPTCWGTSDAVIVSPVHVEIVDLKYGKGVAVEAEGNPQLRLYALGALDTFGDMLGETQEVLMTVFQPRLGNCLTEKLHPDELRAWRAWVLPVADQALNDPEAPFGPSETACRWCPASGRCRAQLEDVFKDGFDEIDPAILTPEEVAETQARLPQIRDWLEAFEKAALTMAYSESRPIPGWKVVMSSGRRYFADEVGAIDLLSTVYGYDLDEISRRKIIGIGDMERLLKRDKQPFTIVEPFIRKGDGKPSLVPESDKRRAVTPETEATKVFQKLEGETT